MVLFFRRYLKDYGVLELPVFKKLAVLNKKLAVLNILQQPLIDF
jgi:hypothetical protein